MLDEALRVGSSKWTGAGHSAVYLSGVCMASPVKLRMCEPGENGVVLTNYRLFGEDRRYEWNAIPLNVYLYGVEDESARPLYASPTVRWMLQERYREKYMAELCTGSCATNPNALWRETVASYLHPRYLHVHLEDDARAGPRAGRQIQPLRQCGPLQRSHSQLRRLCARDCEYLFSRRGQARSHQRFLDHDSEGNRKIVCALRGASIPSLSFTWFAFRRFPASIRSARTIAREPRNSFAETAGASPWRSSFPTN